MRKILAFIMCIVLFVCSVCTSVYAAEATENAIPENATRHTIAITLAPEEEFSADVNIGDAASPYVWGDPSMSIIDNHSAYTKSFYLSDRYFAYEMEGFLEDGNVYSNEGYSVILEHAASGAAIASMSGYADHSLYKLDWITIPVDGDYRFQIVNQTDYNLTVYITYYSWN